MVKENFMTTKNKTKNYRDKNWLIPFKTGYYVNTTNV